MVRLIFKKRNFANENYYRVSECFVGPLSTTSTRNKQSNNFHVL